VAERVAASASEQWYSWEIGELTGELDKKSVGEVEGELSEWFAVTDGVRQECNLSPDLFNMILEAMVKKALENVNGGVAVDGLTVNNLQFAEDIGLVSQSPQQLQEIATEVNKSSKRFELCVNEQKTKTMAIGKNREDINLQFGSSTLEQVADFVYLGSLITEDRKCEKYIITFGFGFCKSRQTE